MNHIAIVVWNNQTPDSKVQTMGVVKSKDIPEPVRVNYALLAVWFPSWKSISTRLFLTKFDKFQWSASHRRSHVAINWKFITKVFKFSFQSNTPSAIIRHSLHPPTIMLQFQCFTTYCCCLLTKPIYFTYFFRWIYFFQSQSHRITPHPISTVNFIVLFVVVRARESLSSRVEYWKC